MIKFLYSHGSAFTIIFLFPLLLGGTMKNPKNEINKIPIFNVSTGNVEELERVYKTEAEWKKILTPEQFKVMRGRCKNYTRSLTGKEIGIF